MALIEVESLCKEHRLGNATVRALDNVNLLVREGESCAIAGESGAGKSTLARILVGRTRPTSGRVRVAQTDVGALSPRALKKYWRNVQLVGQDPRAAFDPRRSAGAALAEVLCGFDIVPRSQVRGRSLALLEMVGLDESFLPRYPHEMSGGQLQRLAIARALAPRPRLLVLDEPTSALDSITQRHIVELLINLKSRRNITYLTICHDLALARLLAPRTIVMHNGRVVEDMPSDALRSSPESYVQSLLAAEDALSL